MCPNFVACRFLDFSLIIADRFTDPLQHVASEVFVLLLHGLLKLYRETESSGKSLYDKYKNMNEGKGTPFCLLIKSIRSYTRKCSGGSH